MTRIQERRLRQFFSLMSLLWMTGCTPSLQSREPASETYVLRPTVMPLVVQQPLSLQVLPVRARPGYATDSVLRSGPERILTTFAASRWPDALPRMVEGLLVDGLKAAGLGEVLEPLSSARADLLLQAVILRFDADYGAGGREPRIHLALDVTLMGRVRRETIASFTVQSIVPVSQNRMGVIVAGFEQAAADLVTEIARRLVNGGPSAAGIPRPRDGETLVSYRFGPEALLDKSLTMPRRALSYASSTVPSDE